MARISRRLPGVPAFVLTAPERHLLDCVDGTLDEAALAFMCGREPGDVGVMLARLVEAGVVSFDVAPVVQAAPVNPAYGDGIELPREFRDEVDALWKRLELEDGYQLLGVANGASKEEIRAAYYRIGPRFHPDRHFRKKLGPYKQKIEAIFAALTKAQETLRSDAHRAGTVTTLPSASGSAPAPGTLKSSEPPPSGRPSEETDEQRSARRVALARKFSSSPGASTLPRDESHEEAVPVSTPRPPAFSGNLDPSAYPRVEGIPSSAAERLRDRFDQVGNDVREKRLRRYLASAEDAMNLGDYRTAVAAYVQASKLAPEDADVAKLCERASKLAGMA